TLLIDLRGPRGVWVDLAVPSVTHLRAVMCGKRAATDSSGVVIGHVLDARTHSPVSGALITGDWVMASRAMRDTSGIPLQAAVATASDGGFLLCWLPTNTDVRIRADAGGRQTGAVSMRLPPLGMAQRDLYVADSEPIVVRG